MQTKVIDNDIFFSEVTISINEGERVRIRAKGNSMLPLIRNGKDDIILNKTNNQTFQNGRLILVKLIDERYVIHRIKNISNNDILLHGDGNLSLFETCTREDVIAEATEVIRNGRQIKVGSWRWNIYRHLWPSNLFLRRIYLAIYRRTAKLSK